jgi:hypothetical protein
VVVVAVIAVDGGAGAGYEHVVASLLPCGLPRGAVSSQREGSSHCALPLTAAPRHMPPYFGNRPWDTRGSCRPAGRVACLCLARFIRAWTRVVEIFSAIANMERLCARSVLANLEK